MDGKQRKERGIRVNSKVKFICAGILFILFIVLILLLKKVDVATVGPEQTSVGFSGLNKSFHEMTGENMTLYKITDYLGYAALAVVGVFGLMGLIQLIQRKSLFKVDHAILALGVLYIVVMGMYVLFEKVIINYRPVIMEGDAHVEASFPSSHTVLAVVVLGSAMMMLSDYIQADGLRLALELLCIVVMVFLVIGRLFSGVHWLTDIIGGTLISGALLFLFAGVKEILAGSAASGS